MPFADPISRTARLTAAARARESKRPDRLFDDPWAEALAGAEGFALMAKLEDAATPAGSTGPRDNPYIAIRTKAFDDFLTTVVSRKVPAPTDTAPTDIGTTDTAPIRQVVLLAAGLDTRAFRLDWPTGTRLFEMDRPDVLAAKDSLLQAAGAHARCERRTVGTDLAGSWADALVEGGFDPRAPSAWLVEGLFPYLEEAGARSVLTQTATLAAPGSRLRADVIAQQFFDSHWTRPYLDALAREKVDWKFGTDEPEAFFATAGWEATAVRPGEEGANFGRWKYPVAPRGTPGIPTTFLMTARR